MGCIGNTILKIQHKEELVQKPITILKSEFVENITNTVNSSGLPFFAIRQVLTELLEAVRQAEEAQEQKDRAEYERYLQETAAQTAQDDTGKAADEKSED